ncbi:MAG: DUF3300 domain-containing protein [Stellaceae bacterium]
MYASPLRASVALLAVSLLSAGMTHAQNAPDATPAAQSAPLFQAGELDQMVAQIALYPDDLLAQVLMAATYPLEVVQAERWVKDPKHAKLKGDQLAAALQNETWDPSVKSLVPFPQVLQMMSDKLDWTQRLGDAFLAQEKDVMESVQRLRRQAQAAGSLETTEQQKVVIQDRVVVIQPANPQVVYVPVYNPTVVYGAWPYPAYPPVYYPPPPAYYPYGSALVAGIGFATGVAVVNSMWGWSNCNWHGGSVNVNYNTYNSINRTNINAGRATQVTASASGNWQHQSVHRGGVAYRDPATRQAYQPANATSAGARQSFRGYDTGAKPAQGAGQGARQAGQGAVRPTSGTSTAGPGRAGASAANRPSAQAGQTAGQGARQPNQQGQGRPAAGAANRPAAQPAAARQPPAAFSGVGSGRDVSAQSARGQASRQASGAARGAAAPAGRGGGGPRR